MNIANKACLKEKTRLATPDTQEDKDALNTAFHQNSGTMKVDQSGNYELMMGFMKHTSGGATPTESFSWNDRCFTILWIYFLKLDYINIYIAYIHIFLESR